MCPLSVSLRGVRCEDAETGFVVRGGAGGLTTAPRVRVHAGLS